MQKDVWTIQIYNKDGSHNVKCSITGEVEADKIWQTYVQAGYPAPTIYNNDIRVLGY